MASIDDLMRDAQDFGRVNDFEASFTSECWSVSIELTDGHGVECDYAGSDADLGLAVDKCRKRMLADLRSAE